jgi:hypothetical protein
VRPQYVATSDGFLLGNRIAWLSGLYACHKRAKQASAGGYLACTTRHTPECSGIKYRWRESMGIIEKVLILLIPVVVATSTVRHAGLVGQGSRRSAAPALLLLESSVISAVPPFTQGTANANLMQIYRDRGSQLSRLCGLCAPLCAPCIEVRWLRGHWRLPSGDSLAMPFFVAV